MSRGNTSWSTTSDDYEPLDHVFEAAEMRHLRRNDPPEPDEEEQEPGFADFIPEVDAPEHFLQ